MADFIPTYVSSSSFYVSGDQRDYFPSGIRVLVECGSGLVKTAVSSSELYGTYGENTLVTLYTSELTSPCNEVFVSISPDCVPVHAHDSYKTGGPNVVGKAPEHAWNGTELRFKNPDGSWGSYVDVAGASGADGVDGATIYTGSGAPSDGNGVENDLYYNTANGDLYKKGASTWGSPIDNLTGPQGLQGEQGEPGDTGSGVSWRSQYSSANTYAEADIVYNGGNSYICIQANGSGDPYEPGVTSGWESYWEIFATTGGVGITWKNEWADLTEYAVNDAVSWHGSCYICKSLHTASSTTMPNQGVDWMQKWDLMAEGFSYLGDWAIFTDYLGGDIVLSNGSSFICITSHTSSSDDEPGFVNSWGTYWAYFISAGADAVNWGNGEWQTSTNYYTRDGSTHEGSSYVCLEDHESDASTEPGVGVYWAAKWQLIAEKGEAGAGAGGAPPDWCPPAFKYKDADEIYVPAGRYYKGGYRHRGQYQDLTGLASYWDVSSILSVDIDGTYAAGSVSGMIGGAKVNSSWYSVFMMGDDANSLLILPFVRIKAIAYSAPDSVINPGDHDTGASYEDGFILANDAWNTYRLVKWSFDVYDGTVYTISDSVTGTHDEVRITGDKTSELAAGEWLQLVPPSGTDCVYLGVLRVNGSGQIIDFKKNEQTYTLLDRTLSVDFNVSTTTPVSTDVSSVIPPNANRVGLFIEMNNGSAGSVQYHVCNFYLNGETNIDNAFRGIVLSVPTATLRDSRAYAEWTMAEVSKIRNAIFGTDGSTKYSSGWLLKTCVVDWFKE